MQSPDLFGLEMLWKLEQEKVTKKSDLMILLVHWYLMKNGFRNVGVGDDKTLENSIEQSELLPEGWNANDTSYALRYTINNELYNLHGTLSNDTMIINLLHAKTLQVSNVVFNLETTIQSCRGGKVMTLIDNIDEQISRLDKELVQPIHNGAPTQSSSTQTVPVPKRLARVHVHVEQGDVPTIPFAGVGRADLDPLGRLGGGMLIDPLRPRMPSGMFIPRPRIDPMGPNINYYPNPDHLPPPGGYDNNMFM